MIALFVWEWRQKNPLINLRLFRFKNFAICCFLMMLVGGVLNANTVLQPQFMQQLLGYNATTAGLALTAGGIALVIMMPLAGICHGQSVGAHAGGMRIHAVCAHVPLRGQCDHAADELCAGSWLRVVQMLPLPFCFISITNAAYVGMPKEESNQVAGLINFVRNLGGSILIAITNAQVTSRAMWHQQHLQSGMVPGCRSLPAASEQALTGFFGGQFGGPNGAGMALANIYNQLNQQAQMQGYQDVYMELRGCRAA